MARFPASRYAAAVVATAAITFAAVLATCGAAVAPAEWLVSAAQGDALFTLASEPSPSDTDANLLPNVANGYVGVRLGAASMYGAGLYVGDGTFYEDFRAATRARIPAVSAGLEVFPRGGAVTPVGVALHLRQAVVERLYTMLSPEGGNTTVSIELYAHRARRSLLVLQVTVNATQTQPGSTISVPFDVPRFSNNNSDVQFAPAKSPVANTTAFVGRVAKGEVPNAPRPLVALVATNIPSTLQVPSGRVTTVLYLTALRSELDTADPLQAAASDVAEAMAAGQAALRQEHEAAWATLWAGGVEVQGNMTLATHINSTYYYLLSQNRADFPAPAAPVRTHHWREWEAA